MKLKNKKTGEVFDALIRERECAGSYSIIVCDIKSYEHSKSTLDATHFVLDEYNSLAELNEDWEDYKPAEPLIKDEKIRKAVRAWAEAVGEEEAFIVSYNIEYHDCCIYTGNLSNTATIDLGTDFNIKEGSYTITELCGEEE